MSRAPLTDPSTQGSPQGSFRARLATWGRIAGLLALGTWTAREALRRPALSEAEAAFGRGDHATALRRAEDDLARHPSSIEAARIAARCLSLLRFADRAEPLYELGRERGILPLEARRDRARGFYFCKQFDLAAEACEAILQDAPEDAPTLLLLTQLEFTRDHFAEGAAAAERLAAAPGGRFDGLAWLAMNHHANRNPEAAVAADSALLGIDPTLETYRPGPEIFWYEFAEDLLKINRPVEARDRLLKVVNRLPAPVLLDLLGLALRETGDTQAAEARWRESIRRQSGRANPWLALGRLYNDQKRFAEAAEVLERAVTIDPGQRDSHYRLATAYRFLGRDEEAQKHFARAEEIRRASVGASEGMGPAS